MKVFISWSGTKSHAVAEVLRGWLPGVINALEPFVSSRDIDAGARWQTEIASQLDESQFGIVCVTRENQAEPWLNFEAGALAKAVLRSRVIPLAVDLKPSDIEVPLGQFQAQPATEDGLRKVVLSLNTALSEGRLSDELLQNAFDKWWPDLAERLTSIEAESDQSAAPVRTERELLEETLDTVRALFRAIDRYSPEPIFNAFERARGVRRAIDALPERERAVILLRFGLDGEAPLTLEEIGRRLELTRERVRQAERQGLSRLSALRELASLPDPDETTA